MTDQWQEKNEYLNRRGGSSDLFAAAFISALECRPAPIIYKEKKISNSEAKKRNKRKKKNKAAQISRKKNRR